MAIVAPTNMPHIALGDGVRLTLVRTQVELDKCLESLPDRARFGMSVDLDERGHAHCYDSDNRCGYYLHREDGAISVWTWWPIESYWEAAIWLSLVKAFNGPLSTEAAIDVSNRTTNRAVEMFLAPKRYLPSKPRARRPRATLGLEMRTAARLWSEALVNAAARGREFLRNAQQEAMGRTSA
jgi:hypothetical protein